MVITAILSFIISFVILYITRAYLAENRLFRGDTFFHLLVSGAIRKNKWKFPSELPNVTLCEIDKKYNYLAYPPLFHYLVALFPQKQHEKIAKLLNLVVLSLLSSFAAVIVFNLTLNMALSLVTGIIVILNLSALSLVVQFSPRSFGILFYTLIVYLTLFYPMSGLSIFMIAFFVVALSLTHKFAVQVLIFSFIPYIILFKEPYLVLSFALGFLLSIVISKGFYLKIIAEHFRWLRFYRLRPFRAPVKTYFISIFGSNVWALFIILSIFFVFQTNMWTFPQNDILIKMIYWSLINILISIFISIPTLSFLGEYSRYIEYSIVPIGVTSALLITSLSLYFLLVAVACIFFTLIALFNFKKYINKSRGLVDPEDISSYNTLKENNFNNVIVFPARTLEVNYYSQIRVIHPVRGAETPIHQITHLVDNYRIKYVLKFKDSDPYQLFATMGKIRNLTKILDFNNFELYELSGIN